MAAPQLPTHPPRSPEARVLIALGLFGAALGLRAAALPVEATMPFLTFWPVMVLAFWWCGSGAGWLYVGLSALTGWFVFMPPHWSWQFTPVALSGVGAYVVASALTDLVVRRTRHREAELASVLDTQTEFICRLDTQPRITWVNDTFCRTFAVSRREVIGSSWRPLVHPEDGARLESVAMALRSDGPTQEIDARFQGADGRTRWGHFVLRGVFDESGALRLVQAVGRDMTELHETRQRLQRLSAEQVAMLDNDLVGICRTRDRTNVWKNREFERMFGYGPDELLGAPTRLLYPDDASYTALGIAAYPVLQAGGHYRTQIEMQRKNGERIWVDLSGVRLDAETGESMWMFLDITATRRYQEQVEHIAFHDPLTSLPNRLLLADRMAQGMALDARLSRRMAVIYLDLDGFKAVNDTHGHEAGDALLVQVARRLRRCVRNSDTVARLGGDEFVLLLTPLDDRTEAERVIERVIGAIAVPIRLPDGQEASVTVSAGIALYPDHGDQPGSLLACADQALYEAKRGGRNGWQFAPLPPAATTPAVDRATDAVR